MRSDYKSARTDEYRLWLFWGSVGFAIRQVGGSDLQSAVCNVIFLALKMLILNAVGLQIRPNCN